jgi:RNA polymerase sigma-70 factor (ECF subfamily)
VLLIVEPADVSFRVLLVVMLRSARLSRGTSLALVDDAALARAAADGQPAAAAAIWDHLSPVVRATLRRILGPDSEVDDLTQDVFLRIFKQLSGLRDPQAFRAFVMQVATNAALSELRRRRVRRWLRLTFDGSVPDISVGAVASSPERLAVQALYRILDGLEPESRSAFVLHHIEELALRDVATAMKLSLATVKRRLVKAHARLRRLAKNDGQLRGYLSGGRHGPL